MEENKQYDYIEDVEISKEMRESFLDYSMSVIVQRALPDVRDGMKPVHRRILHAMNMLGITSGVAHKKSARIVGEVIGKYHPHGDTAVYDAMVRMAQDFSYRYPLVDGHGNFGSLDGDGAAAMRYTEARMSKISMEMMRDINKDTVDFVPNYDGEESEPVVLPSRIPNLLINGSVGIAVGMATNIPPHNLGETIQAIFRIMDDPDVSVPELMEVIKGPDFPTGGMILGRKGIRQAYETGRGSIMIRSKYRIEELENGKKRIIFYEIPYQVNKLNLIKKMADLIRDKEIQGVTYLNDESNREGIRIVLELKKDVQEEVILNQLFRLTPLQTSFGINMLALENGRPKQLSLKEILNDYLNHQVEVIVRKTKFDLKKAKDRAHILEGLRIAMDHIDQVIHLIRSSKKDEAGLIQDLCETFGLTEIQAKAILAMQLRRLSGLERDKIEKEYQEILMTIADLEDILANHDRVLQIIREDLTEINEKYGDDRKTEISDASFDMEDEDLIPVEDSIIMLTESGYIKRQPVDTYHTQNRGGRGIKSLTLNEEDSIDTLISMSTHDWLLLFTNKGRVYRMKGFNIPIASRTAKGLPIINLLTLEKDEKVKVLLPIPKEHDHIKTLLFVTRNGIAKRTALNEFDNINRNGKIAISLKEEDELAFVKATTGDDEVMIAGSNGKAVRFKEDQIRMMGRNAAGVLGFNCDGSYVVGVCLSNEGNTVLSVSENGYGKRSDFEEYRLTSRGKKGVRTINITEKTGNLVSVKAVNGDEDAMIVSSSGIMIRISLASVGVYGRNTQGIKLIHLTEGSKVTKVTLVDHDEDEETQEE
ncbi:DNA gyrase subunit A [Faecalicoccus pleomorphus]|uniref:DNA gyrase subunit A n=3 Tax=Faecalicoccus TaxID=1573536 RepID=A0AAW6CSY8_9FIRM|nr:DNA gyrase subunit A [Faecalicoccus pleomorphus]MBM6765351.1 DNA gyrase subunit A [Faecalicoccus pleomorphus]MDB7979787.1 DNA gyrase subunit A [Faecalicoccus pleomorphus]MDB7982050.1 DNA gyrase subunit A [Faecalicoccus pleomorphus]MDB7988132.1 DNA gyrase subunit A [Faecalicoccus pleomorphus]MDB7992481.1 DNA gyrase subunit A [Faecalicoccus pleomorphus]